MAESDSSLSLTVGIGPESESKTRSGPSMLECVGRQTLGCGRSNGGSWLSPTVAIIGSDGWLSTNSLDEGHIE